MNSRTLVLKRETLALLENADLARVAGGDSGTAISEMIRTCESCDPVMCAIDDFTDQITTITTPITTVVSVPC